MYRSGNRVYNDVEYHEFCLRYALPGMLTVHRRRIPEQRNEHWGGVMVTEEEVRKIMKSIMESLDSINSTLKEINENTKIADTKCIDQPK